MQVAFRESRRFTDRFFSIAGEDDLIRLQQELERDPEKGDVISGAGGARKVRMALRGRGKRGGARVIYYARVSWGVIWLLDVYAKNEKADLSHEERKELATYLHYLKDESS